MSKKQTAAVQFNRRKQQVEPKKNWLYLNVGVAVVLILAGVASLFWLGQQTPQTTAGAAAAPTLPQSGQLAPDFTLTSAAGEPVSLSDFSGQVVLVNTWATWCPPCKAEMPTLNSFYEQHKDEGFVVLAVNSQEDSATVNAFLQTTGFTFPVVLDSRAEVMNLYNVRGLPTSFVIGRDGSIKYVHTGEITQQQLEQVIGPLL